LQFIFDQVREDNNRNYQGGETRIGGLTPDKAAAVKAILTEQARRSDAINASRPQRTEGLQDFNTTAPDGAGHDTIIAPQEVTPGTMHTIAVLAAGPGQASTQEVAA
jgi:hypothetical protein